jgi:hypothetical protein
MRLAAVAGHASRRGHPALTPQTAPVFASAPVIIGTPTVGAVCSYVSGIYTGNPTPNVTRQWTLDGVDIGGATGSTYTPASGDATHLLRVRETATNALASVSSTSASGTVAAAGGGLTWQFSDGATFNLTSSTSTLLATNLPVGATYYSSPDLLPGQTLSLVGSALSITNGTLPIADLDRDSIIEVMDTEQAVAQIMRTGELFGAGQVGPYKNIQYAMNRMQDGDTLQISPGAIYIPGNGDGSEYLEASALLVYKGCTITNIPGRGRWRLAPSSMSTLLDRYNGITIAEPNQTYSGVGDTGAGVNPRKTIVIEGFDFDNFHLDGHGVRLRANSSTGSYNDFHVAITLRNFKIGTKGTNTSLSGIAGDGSETLTLEDGHIYDCGNGGGQDHNMYIGAKNLVMRGIRTSRTRGSLEGHLAKTTFNNGTFEGCVFDTGTLGDSSIGLQAKGGGNLIVRGCLFISGALVNTATGLIVYEKELGDTPPGNYGGWTYGLSGHSVLVEKNVFINHRPHVPPGDAMGFVYCRPAGHGWEVTPASITSFVVRDNLGMSTVPSSGWIKNAPPSYTGGAWTVGNTAITYDSAETPFSNREMKGYNRALGPIAASGSASTYSFVWPHGSVARTDAYRGLA